MSKTIIYVDYENMGNLKKKLQKELSVWKI